MLQIWHILVKYFDPNDKEGTQLEKTNANLCDLCKALFRGKFAAFSLEAKI
jgi:hypothetical protein